MKQLHYGNSNGRASRTEVAGSTTGATEGLVNADGAKNLKEANPEQQLRHGARGDTRIMSLESGVIEAWEMPEIGEAEAELRQSQEEESRLESVQRYFRANEIYPSPPPPPPPPPSPRPPKDHKRKGDG